MDKVTTHSLVMSIINRACLIGGAYLVFPLWTVGLIAMLVALASSDKWAAIYEKVTEK